MSPIATFALMGIVFRQSVKNTIITGIGAVLGAVIMLLSTNYIAKRDLGFIGNFTAYAVALSQILLFGLNSTLVVYIHRFVNDIPKKKLLITFCIILPGVILLLVSVIYILLRSWILGHFQIVDQVYMEKYFLWLPVFILLFIYMTVLEQYLGSQLRVAISSFTREVVLRLVNIVIILLYAFGYIDFGVLVKGTILIYLIPVGMLLLLAMKTRDFGFSLKTGVFSRAEYKEMVHFSWYHFLFSASVLLVSCMDVLLLPFYDHNGFSSVAVYRNAVFLISFLQLPLKALTPAAFTVLAKAFADDDKDKAADFFLRSSINIFIATLGVALLLGCNLQNVVSILKEGYSDIIPIFLILFIGSIVNIATGMNDQVLSITNYYKFNFYLSLVLLVVLFILIRVLVPQFGVFGAAWATTTTIVVFNIVKCIFVWKKLHMLPFSKRTFNALICALPALVLGYFLPNVTNHVTGAHTALFIDVVLRSAVIAIIYFLMLLWLKPSDDMEHYIKSIRKNKRLF